MKAVWSGMFRIIRNGRFDVSRCCGSLLTDLQDLSMRQHQSIAAATATQGTHTIKPDVRVDPTIDHGALSPTAVLTADHRLEHCLARI